MKTQLERLQQTLSVQAELIHSMVQEMALIRREAAMCRDMTGFLFSMLLDDEELMKPMAPLPVDPAHLDGYFGLNPRRLP
ncbi:MAG: hypothetical protein WCI42_05875 [Verrucomicrobiota bacterium]